MPTDLRNTLFALFAPVAIALYPVLFLLESNVGQVEPDQAARSLMFSLLLMAGSLALSLFITRDLIKAALITSGVLVLFFSYGHVYELLKSEVNPLARHRYLLPAWGLLMTAWVYLIWRHWHPGSTAVMAIDLVAITMLAFPILSLLSHVSLQSRPERSVSSSSSVIVPNAKLGDGLPDIYYIVLDAYGREDVLAELYDYDNTEFIATLEDMGFTIADESNSNYTHTSLSLAATMNMAFVNDIANRVGSESKDLSPLQELIANSAVRDIFNELGYEFVAFETGLPYTTLEGADIYLGPNHSENRRKLAFLAGLELNEFEGMLLETTIARVVLDHYIRFQSEVGEFLMGFPYQKQRNRVLFTISSLSDFAERQGDFIIFAHVISPHPPFVFGENGEQVPQSRSFSFQDDGCCARDDYIKGYRDQLTFISSLVELEMAEILARSETPPIIVLQGDHGPGAFLGSSPTESNLRERFGILNAFYLPGEADTAVYPSISPVNTFRLILREYFGVEAELISDESYFSSGARPYELLHISEEDLEG